MQVYRFGLLAVLSSVFVSQAWSGPAGAAETFKIDTEKSKIDFVGKKPDGQHKGGFKKVMGEALVDSDNPEQGSIKIEIDTESLWSDDAKLTDHLKNPDFFNVRKFPKIRFESTKVEITGEAEGMITGKLTMLDKTVEAKVPVKAAKNDDGTIQLKATFKLDRTKWGMNYGVGKINNDVELVADLQLKK